MELWTWVAVIGLAWLGIAIPVALLAGRWLAAQNEWRNDERNIT